MKIVVLVWLLTGTFHKPYEVYAMAFSSMELCTKAVKRLQNMGDERTWRCNEDDLL